MSESSPNNNVIYCLDFDGVLVDSASEMGESGLRAARILFPDASWTQEDDSNIIERFCEVRPCLETGWEAALIIKLLADPNEGSPSNDEIMDTFHPTIKQRLLETLNLTPEACNNALRTARNDWISQNDAKDWLDAHGFYEGACQAVRDFLKQHGNENIYIITTKAKEYALRLLERQGLYDSSNDTKNSSLLHSHIFGLGSGPKYEVLASLLEEQQPGTKAVMVEDNLQTLEKIMGVDKIQDRVIPALACWGYNTKEQQEKAKQNSKFMVLSETASSDIARPLSYKS
eukprot:scaffold18563_cov132-Cylindrotheca_fusiformis.AAC.1